MRRDPSHTDPLHALYMLQTAEVKETPALFLDRVFYAMHNGMMNDDVIVGADQFCTRLCKELPPEEVAKILTHLSGTRDLCLQDIQDQEWKTPEEKSLWQACGYICTALADAMRRSCPSPHAAPVTAALARAARVVTR